MWIKNKLINKILVLLILNINDMYASNIKILQTKDTNKFIMAEKSEFNNNIFSLENVIYYNFKKKNIKTYLTII